MTNKALIYCRVSSLKQVINGTGNQSQEQRCREYCKNKNYLVEKVFVDDGVSGGLFDRPAMHNLIEYLDLTPAEKYIIVFDDLSRFARDLAVHLQLKSELKGRGCTLECLNFNFEDTPEGELIENVTASMNHYDRQKNRRQVIQKQKARLEQGYWCFCPPPALKYIKVIGHGKVLVPDEPLAGIYKEAIEKFANDYFTTQVEVQRFIKSKYKEFGIKRRLSLHGTKRILTELLYTGHLEYQNWDVEQRIGQHKGFISLETYRRVQSKLEGNVKKAIRKDYKELFPLRGVVLCRGCGKPLTASNSKGRRSYYAYYTCKQPLCSWNWKAIPKYNLESAFEYLLDIEGSIKKAYLDLARIVIMDTWNNREMLEEKQRVLLYNQAKDIEKQLDNATNRLFKSSDDTLSEIYEGKIKELKIQKDNLHFELQKSSTINYSKEKLGTAINKVFSVLENPLNTWKKGDPDVKQTIVFMYFSELPKYDRENGFGTVTFNDNINVLRDFGTNQCHLVEMGGVEPPC